MDEESVTEYLILMRKQYETPVVQEHFATESSNQDNKNEHRTEAIRSYSLSQVAQAPSIFRHCLQSNHIKLCLQVLIPVAFAAESETPNLKTQAQFKLFTLIDMLQKLKLGGTAKKGFVKDSENLWLLYVNNKVNAVIKESEDLATLASKQKRVLKFIKKTITPTRIQLYEKAGNEQSTELKLKLQTDAKRALALEKLILSLSLIMAIPEDLEMISETYDQIEELMECFTNLKLG